MTTVSPILAGETVTIRPIHLADSVMEGEFVRNLSVETKHYRFFCGLKELSSAELKRLCDVDGVRLAGDLLSFIPSLTNPADTVAAEIRAFNTKHVPNSKARLVSNGARVDASDLGLSARDRLDLLEILATSEERLGGRRIAEMFQPAFFQTHLRSMSCRSADPG